jgi:phosphatidylserine/phosphatidylglycerophosphate/cardiolipin synthase-like enzyme
MFEHASSPNGIDVYLLSQIDGTVQEKTIAAQDEIAAIEAQAGQVAALFAAFVSQAHSRLDICIYDFRLVVDSVRATVVSAINQAAERGVTVRIAYDKNETDDQDILKQFQGAGGDPAPVGTAAFVSNAGFHPAVQIRPIAEEAIDPGSQIMHNKFMIRDGSTDHASVWTGSTNFTVDAWALQENNIVILADSPDLAAGYEQDFADLWNAQKITGAGAGDSATVPVGGVQVEYGFAPGGGAAIEATIAAAITAAATRVRIASMVLSSESILTAIKNRIDAGIDVQGVYDYGETQQVRTVWQHHPADAGKLVLLNAVTEHLVAKKSAPFLQAHTDWAHNFMHNKIAIADATIVTGSFNFSTNAARNAENIINITDPVLADPYATYIDHLVARYR